MTELYRHYDTNDQLLYVGISLSVLMRTLVHRSNSDWFSCVTKITIERFNTRNDALYAESLAIYKERPLHNIYQTDKSSRKAFMVLPPHLQEMTYSRIEAAKLLGVSSTTLTHWTKKGHMGLKSVENIHPMRWLKSDIHALIGDN